MLVWEEGYSTTKVGKVEEKTLQKSDSVWVFVKLPVFVASQLAAKTFIAGIYEGLLSTQFKFYKCNCKG